MLNTPTAFKISLSAFYQSLAALCRGLARVRPDAAALEFWVLMRQQFTFTQNNFFFGSTSHFPIFKLYMLSSPTTFKISLTAFYQVLQHFFGLAAVLRGAAALELWVLMVLMVLVVLTVLLVMMVLMVLAVIVVSLL